MPLRRRSKGRGLEISLCDFNSIGEAQTRQVASHAGLGEECFQKNSSCSLWMGKKWNLLEEKQGQCVKNSAPVGKTVE